MPFSAYTQSLRIPVIKRVGGNPWILAKKWLKARLSEKPAFPQCSWTMALNHGWKQLLMRSRIWIWKLSFLKSRLFTYVLKHTQTEKALFHPLVKPTAHVQLNMKQTEHVQNRLQWKGGSMNILEYKVFKDSQMAIMAWKAYFLAENLKKTFTLRARQEKRGVLITHDKSLSDDVPILLPHH